jgi:hypothetical protein
VDPKDIFFVIKLVQPLNQQGIVLSSSIDNAQSTLLFRFGTFLPRN